MMLCIAVLLGKRAAKLVSVWPFMLFSEIPFHSAEPQPWC